MTCRYCHRPIYFTGILYRLVSTNSTYCISGPGHMHQH